MVAYSARLKQFIMECQFWVYQYLGIKKWIWRLLLKRGMLSVYHTGSSLKKRLKRPYLKFYKTQSKFQRSSRRNSHTLFLCFGRYKESAKMRSNLLHDRPLKPLDTAVYWIEYVARNGRCEHFRSTALDLTWYQRSMFDIVVFLTAVTIILFLVFYYIIKKILGPNKQKINKKRKNE